MPPRKLLVLDVDGTLVGADSVVPIDAVEVLGEASRAGIGVTLATGRSLAETVGVWRQLDLGARALPIILYGGAMVAEPRTGRTLYQKTIPRDVAVEFSEALQAEGHSAMAGIDPWRHGLDFYMARAADAEEFLRNWRKGPEVEIRQVDRLADVEDLPAALRVHAVVDADEAGPLAERLGRRFGRRLTLHPIAVPAYGVTVIEAHAAGATKWTAIQYLLQGLRLTPRDVIAVGDDVNDMDMLRRAACGAAMAPAPAALRDVADRIVSDGLAAFIREVVADAV